MRSKTKALTHVFGTRFKLASSEMAFPQAVIIETPKSKLQRKKRNREKAQDVLQMGFNFFIVFHFFI